MNLLPRIPSVLFVLLLTLHVSFAQQDFYWVGGSGYWSDASHWATASGGETKHADPPTSADDVYFDNQSFSGSGQTITIDAIAACHDFNWVGATNFPAINADFQLDVNGSVTLNTDVQYNLDDVYLMSGDMGELITTNGASFGSGCTLYFEGTGGWTLAGNMDADLVYLIQGTFSTNNFDISTSGTFYISSTTGNLLDVDLGSSTITCGSFRNSSASDLVFDAGTSEFITGSFRGDFNDNGPFTYYDVTFDDGGILYDNNTINNVSLSGGLLRLESGSTQTLNDLIADGDKYATLEIIGLSDGNEATINIASGIVNIDFVYLKDVHATGGASFTATNSIDNGNTDGWSISGPASKDYYWIGDGGEWDDPAHWATTSGGMTTHGDYPSKFDNVFFDANSFTETGQTVTVNIPDADSKNMDWTGVTNSPSFSAPYESDVNFYGDVIFSMDMTKSIYNGRVRGEGAGLEFHYGGGTIQNFGFYGTGAYTLFDPVTCGNFYVLGGTLNMSDITANVSFTFLVQDSDELTLDMGSAVIYTRDISVSASPSSVITPGTSVINVTRNFTGGDFTFNEVNLTGNGTLKGSNTFSKLLLEPGVAVSFEEGMTQTVTELILVGAKASPININSTNPGTQVTFSVASGIVGGLYLIMQDIEATGGATFSADQTIDNGNNTGWNISGISSQDYYWVGGTGNWSDFENHWATASGGSTFHTGEPGVLDNVYLDANSFNFGDDVLTVDYSSVSMNDLDLSGVDVAVEITGETILNIYGYLNISPLAEFRTDDIHLLSDGSVDITAKNNYLVSNGSISIEGSGTFTLQDSLLVRNLTISDGTLMTNGKHVNVNSTTALEGSTSIVLNLGTSEFITRSFTSGSASNYTIDASLATIIFSSSFSPDYNEDNNVTLGDLIIRQSNGTDDGDISDNITVNNLIVEAGSPITIGSGKTITADQIEMVGTAEDPILLSCAVSGGTGTLIQISGTIDAEYLEIKDNIATGGATFNAYNSVNLGNTSGWTFFKTEQTIDFPVITDKPYNGDPFILEATATSGLDVVYEVISGPATVDGDVLTLTGSIGIVEVKASQLGDIDYYPAQSMINQFEVTGYTQVITFPEVPDLVYGDDPIELSASSSLILNMEYTSSDESIASINDQDELIVHGVGEVTITALQSGNDTVNAVTPVEQIVSVGKAILSISADEKVIDYGDPLPVFTYEIAGLVYDDTEADLLTPVTISSTATDQSDAGTYPITVSGATSNNYDIIFINSELAIDKLAQVITFDPISAVDISAGNVVLEASSDSGLPVDLTLDSGPATLSGSTLTLTGTGEVIVSASQVGDENHLAAEVVEASIIVSDNTKSDQSITFNEITDKAYGDNFALSATATSGLSVIFSVIDGPASVVGTLLSISGIGNVTIRASQTGNEVFNPAFSVERSFNVDKATLTVTADNKSKTFGESNPPLTMSFQGFVNEDDENDITLPTIGTTAALGSNAGEYDITLAGGSSDVYQLSLVKGVLTIEKAEASITLSNLEQDADGTEKSPVITTDPDGLATSTTYNGSSSAPVDAGSYEVIVTISDTNYEGQATETFVLNSLLSTSLDEFGIRVFPNPTSDFLQITGVSKGHLSIIDMEGRSIWKGKVEPMISLRDVASGNYLMIIEDHLANRSFQIRLIKKH